MAEILGRLNKTIAQYISGQAIEMIFVGVATTIGYFIIGQNYALLLGIFAGLTNLIPYVGPYIGLVPAIFVAFTQDVWQVVWVVVVVLIVQQIDSNLIYPRIMGASLNIHPLTIIILLFGMYKYCWYDFGRAILCGCANGYRLRLATMANRKTTTNRSLKNGATSQEVAPFFYLT